MKSAKPLKVVIIGSGNLAWHLASFFISKKLKPEVYNHRASTELTHIKQKLGLKAVPSLKQVSSDADYYFICVSDRYISKVSKKIKTTKKEALVLHCSGSMPLADISKLQQHRAVMYPLQSFSRSSSVNWNEIPLFLQASDTTAMKQLNALLNVFPGKKILCDDASRLKIHLTAVLVNNFTNALYAEAFRITGEKQGENLFHLFLPLIQNGVEKIKTMSPLQAQTGPAKRNDKTVMKKHMQVIKKNKELLKLYRLMSKLIANQQQGIYD
jgi:predicted short-subunit dehydrogenase-like oxidoreductase (DUF2520 family)